MITKPKQLSMSNKLLLFQEDDPEIIYAVRMRVNKIPIFFKIKMPLLQLFGSKVEEGQLNQGEINNISGAKTASNTIQQGKVSNFNNWIAFSYKVIINVCRLLTQISRTLTLFPEASTLKLILVTLNSD